MNISVIVKEDNKYVVVDDKGKLRVVYNEADIMSHDGVRKVLLIENEIEYLDEQIQKCCDKKKKLYEQSDGASYMYPMIGCMIGSAIGFLIGNGVSINSVMSCMAVHGSVIAVLTAISISKYGTFWGRKRRKKDNDSLYISLINERQQLQRELDNIKASAKHKEIKGEIEEHLYSYKWDMNSSQEMDTKIYSPSNNKVTVLKLKL